MFSYMYYSYDSEFLEVTLPNATIDGALLGLAVSGFRRAAKSVDKGNFLRGALYGGSAALAAFIAVDRAVDRRDIMHNNPELIMISRDESRTTFSRYDDLNKVPNYPPAL